MKRSFETRTNVLISIVLIVLLAGALVYNFLMPQNIISYALLGIAVMSALFQLKKTNEKL